MLSLILENHQGYPELIYIRASSGVGVTVEDVLRTIHEELRRPLPRSRLTKLFNVGRYLINTLFYAGRETNQQGVGSCRFEHLGGRDRLQVLPKHPVEDTAPRGPILFSAESLDEPNPLAAAPSFVDATPHLKSYKTTSGLGSIHRTVLGSLSSHGGIFVASPALRDPGTADSPMQHSPGLSQSPLLPNTKSPSPSIPPLPNVGFPSPNYSPQSRVDIPSSVPQPDSPLIATPGTNQMPTRGNEDRPPFTSAVQGVLSDDFSPKGNTHPSLPDGKVDSLKKENQVDWPGLKKDGQVDDLTKNGATIKRRALLIGITYANARIWSPLEGPHEDVDQYQELLVSTYDYRPEDVVVLKDTPAFPEHSQPTRVNVIRELKALVSGATPGDRFTLLYSGHSDQQEATTNLEEEDEMDEMLITSDEKSIIDNELKEILVLSLPVGCSLLAVLDTCHSGTLLGLPHHHCNSVYVPWQSKGERRTMTEQNINATGYVEATLEEMESMIEGRGQSPRGRGVRMAQDREHMMFTQTRYASPEPRFVCDGWCKYTEVSHPNVLSLSSCSDMQRAWDGPNGSLTTILCNYLKKNNSPSYGALMSHINFQLHYNALALHEYTREERKKAHHGQGDGFDGELDNFQEPELSSLVRLNMDDTLQL
ncbi:caspase domain-containing protein [Russula dissimulans]|nr:caspase domain-containing protein [Russula dissimulans]